ncbi:MAG: serine hydrolase, partial [Chloroflexota bacterium]
EPDGGILTDAQKERIYQASLAYLSPSQDDALAVAEQMGYVQYAHPSNMCGPLAIAILRDAGLLSRLTNLNDFWLLRPDTNAITIAKTFPPGKFEHFRFETPTDEFDFSAFPLEVGDVLYLYAGQNGTFEHILTVTRVDEAGRAYTVTNLNTQPDEGYYVIEETMLYDPAQPGVGQFYEWTDRKNMWIGMTGFGGFDLWRFSAPVQDAAPEELALAEKLDSVFEAAGGKWNAIILDPGSGRRVYEHHPADAVHVASVIKVPVAMLLFAALEQKGVPPGELSAYLEAHGSGRTLGQFLRAMLVNSEEDATASLLDYLRQSGMDIPATLSAWGAPATDVFNRTSTVEEIAVLLSGLYRGDLLAPEARRIILDLMAEYTPNDETRLGVLSPLLPEGGVLYLKRGTLTLERLIVGDAGVVAWPSANGTQAYVLVIFGYPGEVPTNDLKLAAGIEQAALVFWDFAR